MAPVLAVPRSRAISLAAPSALVRSGLIVSHVAPWSRERITFCAPASNVFGLCGDNTSGATHV